MASPDYICDFIPPFVRDTTQYPLRDNNNLDIPFTRTEILRKSCIPFSVSLWNSLDNHTRSADSPSSFRSTIKGLRPNSSSNVISFFLNGNKYLSSTTCTKTQQL